MKKSILSLVALAIVLLFLTSCRASGYGCKGKESWGGMVRRINRAY